MRSWAGSHSTPVTNFSTPSVDPGVLIDSPVNYTLHCSAFNLSKWISITYLHSALCFLFLLPIWLSLSFFSSFAHRLFWVHHCLLFPQTPHMMVLLFLQENEPDFSNISSMMECGLFSEALDTLRSAVFPGLLPPATFLISLLEHAQQVRSELLDSAVLQAPLKLHWNITCSLVCFWLFI